MFKTIFSGDSFQGKYNKFFIDLYRRNKTFLIAATAIFMVSVFIGVMGHFLSSQFDQYMTKELVSVIRSLKESTNGGTTLAIFLHNSMIALFNLYIVGIIFGITNILSLVENGILVGFTMAKYPVSAFYILPHGIFEFLGYIIASAAGFRLLSAFFSVIIGGLNLKSNVVISEQIETALKENSWKFKDSLSLLVVAIVILFIAAVIEANITVPLANYITGLH